MCPVKNKVIFITNSTFITGNTAGNPDLFSNFPCGCNTTNRMQDLNNEVIMTPLQRINQKELRKRNQKNNLKLKND